MCQRAFTLLEMLVALSIIGILMAIALPSLRNYIDRTHDQILQSQLLRTIQLARNEASAHHMPVSLCKSKDHLICGGEWADGQLVFIDENEDGMVRDKEQILAVTQADSQRGILHWRSYPYYRDYLQFLPSGLMPSDNGTFWYCHASSELPVWAIMLSKTGKTRTAYPNKSGVIKDSHGKPLRCEST